MAKKNGKKKVISKWFLAVPIVVLVGLFTWWYVATNPVRNYKTQNNKMRLISERQQLDLAIYEQSLKLSAIRTKKE